MTELVIIGTVEFEPGARDAMLSILLQHRDRCLRDEPGTVAFEVLVPAKEPDRVILYERYADRAAFDAHWNGKSMAVAKREAGSRLKGITGTFCTPA